MHTIANTIDANEIAEKDKEDHRCAIIMAHMVEHLSGENVNTAANIVVAILEHIVRQLPDAEQNDVRINLAESIDPRSYVKHTKQ